MMQKWRAQGVGGQDVGYTKNIPSSGVELKLDFVRLILKKSCFLAP